MKNEQKQQRKKRTEVNVKKRENDISDSFNQCAVYRLRFCRKADSISYALQCIKCNWIAIHDDHLEFCHYSTTTSTMANRIESNRNETNCIEQKPERKRCTRFGKLILMFGFESVLFEFKLRASFFVFI